MTIATLRPQEAVTLCVQCIPAGYFILPAV